MTVAEMIQKLSTMPQDLPVAVSDWNEQWSEASEGAAEFVMEWEGPFHKKDEKLCTGKFVIIGPPK